MQCMFTISTEVAQVGEIRAYIKTCITCNFHLEAYMNVFSPSWQLIFMVTSTCQRAKI